MNQLTMLGGKFNEKVRPFAVGDVVVRNGEAFAVIELAPETYAKPALVCVSQRDGRQTIKFESEIDYRRGG